MTLVIPAFPFDIVVVNTVEIDVIAFIDQITYQTMHKAAEIPHIV